MHSCRRILGITLQYLVLNAVCAAAPTIDEFGEKREVARAQLVTGLIDLAKWCDSKELDLERQNLYAQVILVSPDQAEARKALRHRLGPDGKWVAPTTPVRVINRNPKALLEVPERRAAVTGPYCDALWNLVEGEGSAAADAESVYDDILAIEPDEPRVHQRRGDVEVSGKWLMKESAACKQNRERVRAQVEVCLAAVSKGTAGSATTEEQALVPGWSCVLTSDVARVLSTPSGGGCDRMLQVVEMAGGLMDGLFGTRVAYPGEYTIYLLGPDEKSNFVARLPNVPAEQRKMMLTTIGGGVPNTSNVAIWDPDSKLRLDLAVRVTFSILLRNAYGIGPQQGYAYEGLGVYLTRAILGTRLTWWIVPAKGPRGDFFSDSAVTQDVEAQTTRARLMEKESNWLNEAFRLYESGQAPRLAGLTKRHVDKMGVADILVSYALISYLIEGRPEDAHEFFLQAGGAENAEAAARTVLGLSLPQLEKRLHRWLSEVR